MQKSLKEVRSLTTSFRSSPAVKEFPHLPFADEGIFTILQ